MYTDTTTNKYKFSIKFSNYLNGPLGLNPYFIGDFLLLASSSKTDGAMYVKP